MPVTFAVRGPVALPSGSVPGSEAAAFLARAGTLDATHSNAYIDLINGLVSDGVWSLLDVLQIYATDTSANALLNLKSASYTATTISSPTFTSDRGFTVITGAEGVNTGFTPNAGVNYTLNAASLGIWLVVASGFATAVVNATGDCEMYVPYTDTHIYTRINDATYADAGSGQSGVGFSLGVRTSSSGRTSYNNGVSLGSGSATSTSLATLPVIISQVATAQTAAFVAGGNIDSLQGALYTRLRTYMTAVGVP